MSSLINDFNFIELLSNNIPKKENTEKNLLNSSLSETNSDEEFKSSSTNITIEENKKNSIVKDNVNINFEKKEKKENNSFNIKELYNVNNCEKKIYKSSIETYTLDDKINKSYSLK